MAEMLDGVVNDSTEDFSELEAVEAKQAEESPVLDKSVIDSLPEKYRGKKVEDIIKSYEEAEKKASRLGNEVHEVRKLADELIKAQLNKKPDVEQPQEVDYFENPQLAVQNAINSNPRVQAAEQYAVMAQRQMALQTLAQRHPDFQEIDANDEFKSWVGSSPIRQQLYNAAQGYDVVAADELLSTYKAIRGAKQQAVAQVENQSRDKALSSAAVETSGTGETTRKIYRRADIMNLMIRNPAKYASMEQEIARAYEEGRVR